MSYQSVAELARELEEKPLAGEASTYHPIPFPEFAHLKTATNRSEVDKKWQIIRNAIDRVAPSGVASLKVLDIGANVGFYTFSLANEGANVMAFEPHPQFGPIGEFLAKAKALPVDWRPTAFDPAEIKGKTFDVALMLSVFQWMAVGGSRIDEALKELRTISDASKFMIFELGFNSGKSCLKTSKRNHYAELISFLKKNTSYTNFKLLGTTTLWGASRFSVRRLFGGNRYLVLCSNECGLEDGVARKLIRSVRI